MLRTYVCMYFVIKLSERGTQAGCRVSREKSAADSPAIRGGSKSVPRQLVDALWIIGIDAGQESAARRFVIRALYSIDAYRQLCYRWINESKGGTNK